MITVIAVIYSEVIYNDITAIAVTFLSLLLLLSILQVAGEFKKKYTFFLHNYIKYIFLNNSILSKTIFVVIIVGLTFS